MMYIIATILTVIVALMALGLIGTFVWIGFRVVQSNREDREHQDFTVRYQQQEDDIWRGFLTGKVFVLDEQGYFRDVRGDIKRPKEANADPEIFNSNLGDFWLYLVGSGGYRPWKIWKARADAGYPTFTTKEQDMALGGGVLLRTIG